MDGKNKIVYFTPSFTMIFNTSRAYCTAKGILLKCFISSSHLHEQTKITRTTILMTLNSFISFRSALDVSPRAIHKILNYQKKILHPHDIPNRITHIECATQSFRFILKERKTLLSSSTVKKDSWYIEVISRFFLPKKV